MERVGGRYEKMEGHFSTGQSPQWAVVPMEEEECYYGSENLINDQRKRIRNLVGRNFMDSSLLVVLMGKGKEFSYGVRWYGRCSDFVCCYHAVKCDSAIKEFLMRSSINPQQCGSTV